MQRLKWFVLCLTLLVACSLLATLPMRKASAQQEPAAPMSESAARQINSLIQEKESRTAAQKKIDSQLLYAAKENRGERITNEVETLEVNVNADENGVVPVDIQANVTRDLLKSIARLGGEIVFASAQYRSVTARVPLQALEQIAASGDVNFIYPADRARTNRFSGFGTDNTAGTTSTIKVNPSLQPALRPDFAERAARVRKQIAAALALRKLRPSAAMLMPTGPVDSEGDTTHRAAEARTTKPSIDLNRTLDIDPHEAPLTQRLFSLHRKSCQGQSDAQHQILKPSIYRIPPANMRSAVPSAAQIGPTCA